MDTDSQYLFLAMKELEDCIQPELKTEWERLWLKDCSDFASADASGKNFPRKICDK